MIDTDLNYEEDLKKEKKRRKYKIYGKLSGLVIMGVLIVMVYLTEPQYSLVYYILAVGYIVFITYKLLKDIDAYRSLMDDLLIEDDHIIKHNEDLNSEIMRIPIHKIKKVHYNIEELPRTLYIVYEEEGNLFAENFYKPRIEEKKRFIEMMEEKGLLVKDPTSFKTLKEEIESSS